nr:ATP-binding cassette domain-containing protein [Myxococcota bacterium]
GQDVQKKVESLSGGEAARLVFCRIMVQQPNVLVLDEPTNHLDLESIEALIQALLAFEGTVVFVSHDRAFVSALATRVLEVTESGFRDFPGSYDDYLAHCGDDHLDASSVALRAKRDKAAAKPASSADDWEAQKRRKNRKKQLPAERDRVLAAIEKLEARRAFIQAEWCRPGFFEETPRETVQSLEREQSELAPQIDALMAQWESLEAEITALADS